MDIVQMYYCINGIQWTAFFFFFKFPISAITHYHKISSSKTTQIYLTVLEVRISLAWIQGMDRATIFLPEALRQNLFLGFSSFYKVLTFLWLMVCLFLHLQSQEGSIFSSLTSVFLSSHHFLTLLPLSRTRTPVGLYRAHLDNSGQLTHSKILNPIGSEK